MIMKSRAELLKALYSGVLDDAASIYPEKARSFARDYVRLQTIIDRNELWFFTIFLPTFTKHLTRCLDERVFLPFPGPHMRTKEGCVYPRLFSGLTEEIFDVNGALREDVADSTPLFILQTLLAGAKKLRMECDDVTVRKTVASFVETEENVRHYTLNWGNGVLRHDRGIGIVRDDCPSGGSEAGALFHELYACDPKLLSSFGAIQSVADRIFSSFGSPFYTDLRPRHGPGAIADRGNNPSKYNFHSWPAKLEACFPYSVFGLPNAGFGLQPTDVKTLFGADLTLGDSHPTRFGEHLVPSRLIAVPKTQKGPRLIAAEPVSGMWMQQAVLRFLVESVASSPLHECIDFFNQSHSGKLALESSLTQSHSTIDLSDASDRLSCWLVERLFRSNYDLLQAFNAVRTDTLAIPPGMGKEFPKLIKLKKFTTQGSALTFPVQTMVYAVIVIGVLIEQSKRRVTASSIRWAARQVRLFGDDIIVPTQITGNVVECLEALGFKVNSGKTFSKGFFRESCGVDGYMGQDITPAYVLEPYDKAKPSSVSSIVECSNNFFKKGLWHAAEKIASTLPLDVRKRILTVGSRAGAFGFTSFVGTSTKSNRSRFNRRHQTPEVQCLTPSAKVDKTEIEGDFALLQYFTEVPHLTPLEREEAWWVQEPRFNPWSPGEARRPKLTMKLRWVPVEILG